MNKEKEVEQFYKYPMKLMIADGYVSPKTSEYVKMTENQKKVYIVMKTRNAFFDKHFDTQEDIGDLTNIDVRSIGTILRSFIDNGIVQAHKGKGQREYKNWRYDEVLDLKLYKVDKSDKNNVKYEILGVIDSSIWCNKKKLENKPEPKYSPTPKTSYSNNFDDESDLPF